MTGTDDRRTSLVEVLADAQRFGFIGPRPVEEHLVHAEGFGRAWEQVSGQVEFAGRAVDLGSGGGLPGLVLARRWPMSRWTLLDANQRRTEFLQEAVSRLALADRVSVVRARAEEFGRADGSRGAFALVTARGFAAPGPTSECAAPLLEIGGRLVVSEPPADEDDGTRWSAAGLATLGLADERVVEAGSRYRVLRAMSACPPAYPRRTGVPEKRPLF